MAKKTLTQQMLDKGAETNKSLPEPYEIVFRKHEYRSAKHDITLSKGGVKFGIITYGEMPSDVLRRGMLELEYVLECIKRQDKNVIIAGVVKDFKESK